MLFPVHGIFLTLGNSKLYKTVFGFIRPVWGKRYARSLSCRTWLTLRRAGNSCSYYINQKIKSGSNSEVWYLKIFFKYYLFLCSKTKVTKVTKTLLLLYDYDCSISLLPVLDGQLHITYLIISYHIVYHQFNKNSHIFSECSKSFQNCQ